MKSFKNITALKEEKIRLLQERIELEKKIDADWKSFKHSLKPLNIARQIFSKSIENNTKLEETRSFVADSVSQIVVRLTKILTEKVEDKIENWIKKK